MMREVSKVELGPEGRQYPILAEYKAEEESQRYVVLFDSDDSGMVVHASPDANHKVGTYLQGWYGPHIYDQCWRIFAEGESITLEQD